MRYVVEVGGRQFEVEVQDAPQGTLVRLGGREPAPARLVSRAGPLCALEHGTRRSLLLVELDPEEAERVHVQLPGRTTLAVTARDARIPALARAGGAGGPRLSRMKSPMPGVIVEVRVTPGQEVERGQVLLILEAMKMQNEIRAEGAGRIKAVKVSAGTTVAAGALLLEFGE